MTIDAGVPDSAGRERAVKFTFVESIVSINSTTMNSVQKLFLKTVLILIALVILIGQAQAQDCPPDKVCLDRAQAARYLIIEDENTALKAEIKVKDAVIADAQKEIGDWRVKYAQMSGENTALKQNALQDRAIITAMIPMLRPKKIGINLF